jgi:hypothetical protein
VLADDLTGKGRTTWSVGELGLSATVVLADEREGDSFLCAVEGIHEKTVPDVLLVSEERCWGGDPLQIFVRNRLVKRDVEFVFHEPIGLLQMVGTMA